ncbi:MAG: hypothetical protein M3R38_04450 [Actinomycetota bacterium]|nr:hypothetical protein [Actinomycetota bacterium]MDP9484327.1 hypothetical protein [Actinomycetota bacterium]
MADGGQVAGENGRGKRNPLTPAEAKRLRQLEKLVERGMREFVAVGRALREIQDSTLYREDYPTFGVYCERRWDLSRSTAYRRIDQAIVEEVLDGASPAGDTMPVSERQARAIAPLAKTHKDEALALWVKSVTDAGGARNLRSDDLDKMVQAEIVRLDGERKAGTPIKGVLDPVAILDANPDRVLGWHQGKFWDFVDDAHGLLDRTVSLLLVDPPYGKDYRSRQSVGHDVIEGDLTPAEAAALLDKMLDLMAPKLDADAHVVIFCDPEHEPIMRGVVKKHETMPGGSGKPYLRMRSFAVWSKGGFGQGDVGNAFAPTHERMIHATMGSPGFVPGKRPADVLRHQKVNTRKHPTRKPLGLLEALIESLTQPDALVADPFGGSGSTLLAAVRTGRRAWGCELKEGYHATGQERIAEALRRHRGSVGKALEIHTEVPRVVHRRFIDLVGAEDEQRESLASPLLLPEGRDRLAPLVAEWLGATGGQRSVIVEPYAVDADAAVHARGYGLARRAVIASEDPSARAFWGAVLAPGQQEGYGRPDAGPARELADRVAGFAFSEREARAVAESSPAGGVDLAFSILVRSRISGAEQGYDFSRGFRWDAGVIGGRVGALGNAAAAATEEKAEFRAASAMDVLRDDNLTGDPDAAFFLDVPEGEASGRLLGALKRLDGDFLAVVDEELHLRRAARERDLDARRLPFPDRPDRLLVGRDLSWLDEGPPAEVEMAPLFDAANPAP